MSTYGEHALPVGFTSHIGMDGPEFYLGTHRPNWLAFADVPLFISAATMSKWQGRSDNWPTRKADGFGCGTWALDSGAFTALTADNPDHPWHRDGDTYGGMVTRFADEIGIMPQFAAIQDWPCEPTALARNGFTVKIHQELTIMSYLDLAENFWFIPWMPVIQGWTLTEYLDHADQYAAAGVDLAACDRVGIGSICRRGSDADIAAIVETFAARGYQLHGFGVKTSAMRRIGHLFRSADSMAWSDVARKENITLLSCRRRDAHGGQDPNRRRRKAGGPLGPCNNCLDFALVWRERVLTAAREARQGTRQLALDLFAAA